MTLSLPLSSNSIDPKKLQQVVEALYNCPNVDQYINRFGNMNIRMTDNLNDNILSAANRSTIASLNPAPNGGVVAGFAQEVGRRVIWINLNHWKPALNIFVHELLHHITSAGGNIVHSRAFYAELLSVLELLSIDYTPNQDLGGYMPDQLRRSIFGAEDGENLEDHDFHIPIEDVAPLETS